MSKSRRPLGNYTMPHVTKRVASLLNEGWTHAQGIASIMTSPDKKMIKVIFHTGAEYTSTHEQTVCDS